MFNIGPQELLLILLVALVIVGPKRLPEISRTIGRGLREFRKAQDEVTKTIRLGLDDLERTDPEADGRAEPPAPDGSGEPSEDAARRPAASPPSAGTADDMTQVARTLGRGLAEIRRTRREIQRTFRIDLTDPERTAPAPAAPAPGAAQGPPPSPAAEDAAGPTAPSTEDRTSVDPPDEPPTTAVSG